MKNKKLLIILLLPVLFAPSLVCAALDECYGAESYPYVYEKDPVASAWRGHDVGGPVGGGVGYLHYYNPNDFPVEKRHIVTNESELASALNAATAGHIIWIANSFTVSKSAGTLKTGTILASNRGQGGAGGATITYAGHLGDHLIHCQNNTIVSGLTIVGDGDGYPDNNKNSYPAFSCTSYSGQEFENTYIHDIGWGFIVWGSNAGDWTGSAWNSATPYIHHCDFGGAGYRDSYGVQIGGQVQGKPGSYIVEASKISNTRHHTMVNPLIPGNNYEVRYSIFGQAKGHRGDSQGQLDFHGCGPNMTCLTAPVPTGYGAGYTHLHHNTFSVNDEAGGNAANIAMRGLVEHSAEVDHNWTKKTIHTGLYPTAGGSNAVSCSGYGSGICQRQYDTNGLFNLEDEEGESWTGAGGTNDLLKYKCYVHDNWYGAGAPQNTGECTYVPIQFDDEPVDGEPTDDEPDDGEPTDESGTPPTKYAQNTGEEEEYKLPAFEEIETQQVYMGDSLSFTVIATDPSRPVTYTASGLPEGSAFDKNTGEFSWTPGGGAKNVYYVDFKATNGNNTTTETVTIVVLWVADINDKTEPKMENGYPSGVISYYTKSTQIGLTTNELANCRYSEGTDQSYDEMEGRFDGETIFGNQHSTYIFGLNPGDSKTFYVRCLDQSRNKNTGEPLVINFSVSGEKPPEEDIGHIGEPTDATVGGLINKIINIAFAIGIGFGPIMILIGAYLYMSSGGVYEKIKRARIVLILAVIGTLIILLAKSIQYIVANLVR